MKTFFLLPAILFSYITFAQHAHPELLRACKISSHSGFKKILRDAESPQTATDFFNFFMESNSILELYRNYHYHVETDQAGGHADIYLITKNDLIISCNMKLIYPKWKDTIRYDSLVPVYDRQDPTEMSRLQTSFFKKYRILLQEKDLWDIYMVAGPEIGIFNNPNRDYFEMKNLADRQNRDSLMLWVRSPGLCRQMYGAWGMCLIAASGSSLTTFEKKYVQMALRRKEKFLLGGAGCEVLNVNADKFVKTYHIVFPVN